MQLPQRKPQWPPHKKLLPILSIDTLLTVAPDTLLTSGTITSKPSLQIYNHCLNLLVETKHIISPTQLLWHNPHLTHAKLEQVLFSKDHTHLISTYYSLLIDRSFAQTLKMQSWWLVDIPDLCPDNWKELFNFYFGTVISARDLFNWDICIECTILWNVYSKCTSEILPGTINVKRKRGISYTWIGFVTKSDPPGLTSLSLFTLILNSLALNGAYWAYLMT